LPKHFVETLFLTRLKLTQPTDKFQALNQKMKLELVVEHEVEMRAEWRENREKCPSTGKNSISIESKQSMVELCDQQTKEGRQQMQEPQQVWVKKVGVLMTRRISFTTCNIESLKTLQNENSIYFLSMLSNVLEVPTVGGAEF
jgi:hypothetical protein